MYSEWMKVMLEEVARKREEVQRAREEAARRAAERGPAPPPSKTRKQPRSAA
jgi:hypothetical protein